MAITSCTATNITSVGMGVLRFASFPIAQMLSGGTEFNVVNNFGPNQQMPAPGDSGSGIFMQVRNFNRPIGVLSSGACLPNPLEMTEAYYTRSDAIRGWLQGVVGWGPRVGNGIGYERSDGVNAVNYTDSNGYIKEISNSGTGWNTLANLTTATGAQPTTRNANLSSYVRTDGVNAVVYGGWDGNVYELSAGSAWSVYNMTASMGLPTAVAFRAPATYVRSDNTSAVVYAGSDGNVYEMRLPSGGAAWLATNLSAQAGAPPAGTGAIGYVRADGMNVVVYTATNGDVIELSLVGTQWYMNDLTALTGAPPAAGQARPYSRADTYSSIVFRASNGHVWEIFLNSGGPTWYAGDLTTHSGCPVAASDPSPYVRNDNWNAVLFLDSNLHAQEMSLPPGSGWGCHDLTSISNAPVSMTVPDGFVGSDRSTNVIITVPGGHVWDLTLNAPGTNGWSGQDLTLSAGGP